MNEPPAPPATAKTPKMSVKEARLVLDKALQTELQDRAAALAHKRATNVSASGTPAVPPEIISDPEQGTVH